MRSAIAEMDMHTYATRYWQLEEKGGINACKILEAIYLTLYVILQPSCLTIVRIDSHAYICCLSIKYW